MQFQRTYHERICNRTFDFPRPKETRNALKVLLGRERFVVYDCGGFCGGLGDRFQGMLWSLNYAYLHAAKFVIQMRRPEPFQSFFVPRYGDMDFSQDLGNLLDVQDINHPAALRRIMVRGKYSIWRDIDGGANGPKPPPNPKMFPSKHELPFVVIARTNALEPCAGLMRYALDLPQNWTCEDAHAVFHYFYTSKPTFALYSRIIPHLNILNCRPGRPPSPQLLGVQVRMGRSSLNSIVDWQDPQRQTLASLKCFARKVEEHCKAACAVFVTGDASNLLEHLRGHQGSNTSIALYETPFKTTHLDRLSDTPSESELELELGPQHLQNRSRDRRTHPLGPAFNESLKTFGDWYIMSSCAESLWVSNGGYGFSMSYAMLSATHQSTVRRSWKLADESACEFRQLVESASS